MSPRWNWDSPTPLAASECALPPYQRVGGHTRLLLKGWGSPNSNDWRNAWHSTYSVLEAQNLPDPKHRCFVYLSELKLVSLDHATISTSFFSGVCYKNYGVATSPNQR